MNAYTKITDAVSFLNNAGSHPERQPKETAGFNKMFVTFAFRKKKSLLNAEIC